MVFVGQSWRDGHNKRVAVYGFFEEMPIGFQRFLFTFKAAFVVYLVHAVLYWIGILPDPAGWTAGVAALGGVWEEFSDPR